ncbi:MAG: ABC transporter ATP-binding protein, partial [Candidatus Dormibacteraceae bacterium]
SWPGTLVVVSHDRYLIERVCDTVVALLGDGRITQLPGGIDEYLQRSPDKAEASTLTTPATTESTGSNAAEQRQARKTVARLERQLETLAGKQARLHEAMAQAGADTERLLVLDTQLRSLHDEQNEIEQQWLAAAEAAE